MSTWDFLWTTAANGLLLDNNHDGLPDGVAACFVPLDAERFTPAVWAAAANFAARLGLESAALRLPLVATPAQIADWQTPLLLTLRDEATLTGTPWASWKARPRLHEESGASVAWIEGPGPRALWVHAHTADALARLLNEMAADALPSNIDNGEKIETEEAVRQPLRPIDWAELYHVSDEGLFSAGTDGVIPIQANVRLLLGPACDAEVGTAAIHLAARIGLETAGLTLPLARADADGQAVEESAYLIKLGFDAGAAREAIDALTASPTDRTMHLSAAAARFLAYVHPYLDAQSQAEQQEERALGTVLDHVRALTHAHAPLVRLALAETQAGQPLHLHAPGIADESNLRRVVFRQEWNPPDGLDDIGRVRRTFLDEVLPKLPENTADGDGVQRLTLFCDAPRSARQRLADELTAAAADANRAVALTVLPVHKAGLSWLLDTQLPRLRACNPARLVLHFCPFRPPSDRDTWLDLTHRWLQELYPADALLQRALELSAEDVQIEMMPTDDADASMPIYRLDAYDANGDIVHEAALHLLWSEREYMAGMPEYGLVHPSTGGILWHDADGTLHARRVPTDCELFWDFYQQSVLAATRRHLLEVSNGRPTPESEPFFDALVVDGFFGGPDESLELFEEFVSVGEALHEDIYFNTLDYLAALGEQFSGRPIEAAGQVLPLIHGYFDADGHPTVQTAPRATVTLTAWQTPIYRPDLGLHLGDRRDMPRPQQMAVRGLQIDDAATRLTDIHVEVVYDTAAAARLAARVLQRWCELAGDAHTFPPGVAVHIACCHGNQPLQTVTVRGSAHTQSPSNTSTSPACDSDVIGPAQLTGALDAAAQHPGVRAWRVGESYQGRTGYALDVTLPLAPGQTHISRLKLSLQKPTCFIVARHHANEVSSTTAAFDLAHELTNEDGLQPLLQCVNVVLLPMANPDGAAAHYQLMAEHPRWKHHAARFNAAGKEIGIDHFDPATPFGEARFRMAIWRRWLPDAIVDNHGVPSHEWCQPFAGYNTPPRFRVSYHVVQAMLYGIITFLDDPARPHLREAALALRSAVTDAVANTDWLHARNQYWLARYAAYGNRWAPEISPIDVQNEMLFFFRGVSPAQVGRRRNFAMRFPQITLLDWVTEVPDETAQGAYLAECAAAHRVANLAMLRLVADSAQPMQRRAERRADGRTHIWFHRTRRIRQGVPT